MVTLVPGMVSFRLSQFTSLNCFAVLHVIREAWAGVHLLQTIPKTEKKEH